MVFTYFAIYETQLLAQALISCSFFACVVGIGIIVLFDAGETDGVVLCVFGDGIKRLLHLWREGVVRLAAFLAYIVARIFASV